MGRFTHLALAVLSFAALGAAIAPPAELPAVSAGPQAELSPDVTSESDPATLRTLAYLRSRHTGLAMRELRPLAELITREARRYDLEPELVLAVIRVESSGYNFAVSHVGALGLMQIMPATGEELAREHGLPWHGPDTLFNPEINVRLGTAYLRELADRFGSVNTALAAYNWGPGAIRRKIRRGQGVPRGYMEEVLKAYADTTEQALPASART